MILLPFLVYRGGRGAEKTVIPFYWKKNNDYPKKRKLSKTSVWRRPSFLKPLFIGVRDGQKLFKIVKKSFVFYRMCAIIFGVYE